MNDFIERLTSVHAQLESALRAIPTPSARTHLEIDADDSKCAEAQDAVNEANKMIDEAERAISKARKALRRAREAVSDG